MFVNLKLILVVENLRLIFLEHYSKKYIHRKAFNIPWLLHIIICNLVIIHAPFRCISLSRILLFGFVKLQKVTNCLTDVNVDISFCFQ